jgi:hypothetical protein
VNSYWSDEDGCCVQPLYCRHCTNERTTTWLGIEIKALTGTRRRLIDEHQVCHVLFTRWDGLADGPDWGRMSVDGQSLCPILDPGGHL